MRVSRRLVARVVSVGIVCTVRVCPSAAQVPYPQPLPAAAAPLMLMMIVVVAMLGMVPAARATGIGSDIQRPLATVVVGGLLSTLFLTLTVLPSLYCLVARRKGEP